MKIAEAYVEIKAKGGGTQGEAAAKAEGSRIAGVAIKSAASVFAAARIGDQIAKSIQASSRLQQSVGATEAVFGKASRAVDVFAETSADSFGISAAGARELTAQIGALLKGFGYTADEAAGLSVDLAKLGADLSATFGGSPEEAVQAIGAALRGETDPLERFGVSLNQTAVNLKAVEMGLATSTSQVDQHAKAQASLALIMDRTKDAQGQFAREADTAAGAQARAAAKMEDARAQLGQNLIPVYTKAAQTVGSLAEAFGDLPGPVQTGVVALIGLVALAGPISNLVELSKSANAGLGKLGPTGTKVAGGLASAGKALPFIAAGITAAAYVADDLIIGLNKIDVEAAKLRDAAANVDTFAAIMIKARNEGVSTGDALASAFRQAATEGKSFFVETVEGAPVEIFVEDLKTMGLSVDEFIGLLLAGEDGIDAWAQAQAAAGKDAATTFRTIDRLRPVLDAYAAGADKAANNTDALVDVFGEVDESGRDAAEGIDAITAAYDQLKSRISTENDILGLIDDFDTLGELAKENLNPKTTEGQANIRDLERQTNDMSLAVIALGEKYKNEIPAETIAEIVTDLDDGKFEDAKTKIGGLALDIAKIEGRHEVVIAFTTTGAAPSGAYNPADPRNTGSYIAPGTDFSGFQNRFTMTAAQATADGQLSARTFDELFGSVSGYEGAARSAEDAQLRLNAALDDLAKKTKNRRTPLADLEEAQRNATRAAIDNAKASAESARAQAELEGRTMSAAEVAQLQADELARFATTLAPGSPLLSGLQSYIDLLGKVKAGHEDTTEADRDAQDEAEKAIDQANRRAQALADLATANLDAQRATKGVSDATNELISALFSKTKTAEEAAERTRRIADAEDSLVDAILRESEARSEQARLTALANGQELTPAQVAAAQLQSLRDQAGRLGEGSAPRSVLESFIADLERSGQGTSSFSRRGTYTNDSGVSINGPISIANGSVGNIEEAFASILWRARLGG